MSDTGNWTGVGIKPQVSSAQARDSTTVRVYFSEGMNSSGLNTPGNYTITEGPGAVARSVASVSLESVTAPTWVDLILDGGMTAGSSNYNVEVAAVEDAAGNPIDTAADDVDFDGVGERPEIRSVIVDAEDITKARVVYSKAVKQVSAANPDDALNPANYSVTGASQVSAISVSTITTNIVEVSLSGQVYGGEYTLTVQNVEDIEGNPIL